MAVEDYRTSLAESVAFWSVDAVTPRQVISEACDALVAGLESPALAQLAGMPFSSLRDDIARLLEEVARDFGFQFYGQGSASGRIAAAQVFAARCVAGTIAPRDLTQWIYQTFSHGDHEALERLLSLDDDYARMEFMGRTYDDIDRNVFAEAKKLLER